MVNNESRSSLNFAQEFSCYQDFAIKKMSSTLLTWRRLNLSTFWAIKSLDIKKYFEQKLGTKKDHLCLLLYCSHVKKEEIEEKKKKCPSTRAWNFENFGLRDKTCFPSLNELYPIITLEIRYNIMTWFGFRYGLDLDVG